MQIFKRDTLETHCKGSIWPEFLGFVDIEESFIIETAEVGPTGPIEIRDISKGDAISIYIEKIIMEPPFYAPNGGPFYLGCGDRIPLEYKDGSFYWPSRFRLKAQPSVGNIAVLPEFTEEIEELCKHQIHGHTPFDKDPRGWRRVVRDTRGKHCHQDCSFLQEGSIIHMKVNVDGAGVCADDIHGYISEGELAFAGIEVRGSVQLKVQRCTEWHVDWPLIETADELMVVCTYTATMVRQPKISYVDLVKMAYKSMREIVSKKANCTIEEANSIVATACGIRNCAIYGLEGYIAGFRDSPQFPQEISIVGCLPKSIFNQ
ncbi:MAG: hypothetical protein E3J87_02085 [Candidatus Cloacimonadota bacterium]|nr:MAG: hypothetical protein E3J87_02085 [Candidatus Cloacimonadota bacterium]